jgi:amidophosphoribosyltransferase
MRTLVAKMKLIPNKAMLEGKRCLFCDDSIVRGTQLRDNVRGLFELGAKEVHMRIACPPLIYGCPFINFSASTSDMELLTRQVIHDLENDRDKTPGGIGGEGSTPNEILQEYARTGSEKYRAMVEEMGRRLGLTSLQFNTLEILVKAIGLPKCKVCTHCFDGSSYC